MREHYPEYEAVFAQWEAENNRPLNEHFRAVMIHACRCTGVRMEDVLEDSMRDDIMYAKHLVRYALVQHLGYSPSNLRNMMGIARTSVQNSVKYIAAQMKLVPRIQHDVKRMEESIMG